MKPTPQLCHRVILLSVSLTLLPFCANPGRESKAPEPKAEDEGARPLTADGTRASSRIMLKFRAQDRLKLIRASIIGLSPSPALTALAEQPGRFGLGPLKAGTYDVLIEAQRLPEEPGQAETPVALRLSGVDLATEQDTLINDVELTPYLKVKGAIALHGGSPSAGIEVSIPDTSYKTLTAADGSFSLDQVPQGFHSLKLKFAGYASALYELRQYKADQTLPTMTLLPDGQVLPVGVHYLGEAIPAGTGGTATLFFTRPDGMNLLRWGFTPDLAGASWQPFQSSLDVPLAADQRKIFIQFAKDAKQLSTIYSVVIASGD